MELNKEAISGRWNELKGRLKAKWGKLTDDDLKMAEGNFDRLKGRLQSLYGYSKNVADRELKSTLESFSETPETNERSGVPSDDESRHESRMNYDDDIEDRRNVTRPN